ncbi:MAG: hypothetical protein B7Y39_14000 [Bdellovibrio sp. 28-41-41]|nr:MAG: hypothetical protein B7Y39_14000 [Bdellovibrio sp. 28-41-41]
MKINVNEGYQGSSSKEIWIADPVYRPPDHHLFAASFELNFVRFGILGILLCDLYKMKGNSG